MSAPKRKILKAKRPPLDPKPAEQPAELQIAQPYPHRYSILVDELDHLPIKEVYPRLVEALQVDLKSAGEAKLRELISTASEFKRLAGYIYAVAISDFERVETQFEALMGKWSVKAREEIAKLKKAKKWEGGVYTVDVERWIAGNIPEYTQAKGVLSESKKIKDAARRLWEVYEDRLGSLQTYARLIQKRTGLSVEEKHGLDNRAKGR